MSSPISSTSARLGYEVSPNQVIAICDDSHGATRLGKWKGHLLELHHRELGGCEPFMPEHFLAIETDFDGPVGICAEVREIGIHEPHVVHSLAPAEAARTIAGGAA